MSGRLIKAHHIERVIESLKTELSMVLVDGTFPKSESEERVLIEHVLSNLSSDAIISDVQNDIKIYNLYQAGRRTSSGNVSDLHVLQILYYTGILIFVGSLVP